MSDEAFVSYLPPLDNDYAHPARAGQSLFLNINKYVLQSKQDVSMYIISNMQKKFIALTAVSGWEGAFQKPPLAARVSP